MKDEAIYPDLSPFIGKEKPSLRPITSA